jgi:hypothetical protein
MIVIKIIIIQLFTKQKIMRIIKKINQKYFNVKSKSRNLEKDVMKIKYHKKNIIILITKIKFLKFLTIIKNRII